MTDRSEFADYLQSIATIYAQWWNSNAFIDEIDELTWFEFELESKTQDKPTQSGEKTKEKTQLILSAIAEYASEKILITGSPGAGKSTLLTKLLWQAAEEAKRDETAPIPVLVELKLYGESGIWGLIQTALEVCGLDLDIPEIKQLGKAKRLLLLADGFNELPSDRARVEFKKFCGRDILLIVTSRDAANVPGLERKLDLQPPSPQQVNRFLEERLPDCDRAQLQQLGDRVRDLGQTPLMIWMLYSIYRAKHEIPQTRGEAYRAFTTIYAERAKEGIKLTDSRFVLSKLAFEMMQLPVDPTDFRLEVTEVDAQNLIGSEKVLKRLVDFHLLQWQGKPGNRKVRFCHQSLQEYYTAEYLLSEKLLKELKEPLEQNNKILQQKYLNYLKWTEPIALMLGLVEDEVQAVRVVELATGVDMMLMARLAGEVKAELQKTTVSFITNLDLPPLLEVESLKRTRSKIAISTLRKALQDQDSDICQRAAAALDYIDNSQQSPSALLEALDHQDSDGRSRGATSVSHISYERTVSALIQGLEDPNPSIRQNAAMALGDVNSEQAISALIETLEHLDPYTRWSAAIALGNVNNRDNEQVISALCQALREADQNPDVRWSVATALDKLRNENAIPELLQTLQDQAWYVRESAAAALGSIGNPETLGNLWGILHSGISTEAYSAIVTIQSRCQYYNYEIYQQSQKSAGLITGENFITTLYKDLDEAIRKIQENPELRKDDSEDRLTIEIVTLLSTLGYNASHDLKIGGHVDLVVKTDSFLWLAEAKIHRGNNYLWEGFQQLTTRYSIGEFNQDNGGLLIYIFDKDANQIMKNWQNYLFNQNLPDFSCQPCEIRDLAFISTHRHERSGRAFYVRHIPVVLHFSPNVACQIR